MQQTIPGVEALRRQPAGTLVVYAFDGEQAQAWRIHPASAQVLGPYQPSLLPRWVKNLHRQLLLGDAGRWLAASAAAALLVLSLSGWALLLRRMGGWRRLYGPVQGNALQRLHEAPGDWFMSLNISPRWVNRLRPQQPLPSLKQLQQHGIPAERIVF